MKVLLLGEYSGFYYNLKRGLQELGVEVDLFANGDAWKQIPGADRTLYRDGDASPIKRIYNKIITPQLQKKLYSGYDVVQMVHENLFSSYINSSMIKAIKKNNGKVYVNISGNHPTLYKAWQEGKLGYYTYNDNDEKAVPFTSDKLTYRLYRKSSAYVDKVVDGVIPIMYEYALGIRDWTNCKPTIPLPFDTSEIEYKENKVGSKVFFYHGLLRPKDKGGAYIKAALEILRDKYPNDVEICVADILPLKEYLEVLGKTNVMVDQCKEHCWGMNACYGMALGKVVLGGSSYNSLKEFGLASSPIVHIMPNVEQILKQLEFVLENRSHISQWGEESRHFVEEFHNAKRIASMYLDVWKG